MRAAGPFLVDRFECVGAAFAVGAQQVVDPLDAAGRRLVVGEARGGGGRECAEALGSFAGEFAAPAEARRFVHVDEFVCAAAVGFDER